MHKTSKTFLLLAGTVALAGALLLPFWNRAQAAAGDTLAATYVGGTLRLSIPYRGLHPGEGELSVQVLDPEDAVLGVSRRNLTLARAAGVWNAEIPSRRRCRPTKSYGTAYAIASNMRAPRTRPRRAPNPSRRYCARR